MSLYLLFGFGQGESNKTLKDCTCFHVIKHRMSTQLLCINKCTMSKVVSCVCRSMSLDFSCFLSMVWKKVQWPCELNK